MPVKHELTISEMAKIFGIRRDTLLYYDKIGLFKADERRENNYRSYSTNQLPLLDTIINLRELGLPIKNIKEFTKERTAASFLALANGAVNNIDQEIRKLREQQKLLRNASDEIITAASSEYGKIEIVEIGEIPISLSDEGDYSSALLSFDKPYELFMTKHEIPWIEMAGLKFDLKSLDLQDYTTRSYLFSRRGKIRNAVMEKGLYAVSYHKGNWSETQKWNRSVVREAEKMGYKVTGPCYEEYPVAYLVEEDEDNFITKISIKIEQAKTI